MQSFFLIVIHPPEEECNVYKLWNEIKQDYEFKEIVGDWDQKWAGIGYIKKINK